MTHSTEPAWVHGHAHEPNPLPPSADPTFVVCMPDGTTIPIAVADLQTLPQMQVADCFIVSTGHRSSGPFTFAGTRLQDLLTHVLGNQHWQLVDVVSADGFGTRLHRADLENESADRPALLAYLLDGAPLTRPQGLVRLIVPTETTDALRQVKWVARIVAR